MAKLSDFDVLTFDCYGTLIDWETGICTAIGPWLLSRGVTAAPEQILAAFAAAEAPQQEATPGMPYPELLARVHAALAAHFGVAPDAEAAAAFGRSIEHWPPFPDSAAALAYLQRHYKLVILSNVDRASFAHSARRLGVAFDAVYTAEDIGSYKPGPRNFEYMLARLAEQGLGRERILHTAESLYHDHIPAKRFGLATCWIHRRAGRSGHGATRAPEADVRPDFRFATLGEMADAHRRSGAVTDRSNRPENPPCRCAS
jgi:2-haloalkanoic acid dehalogenase type II